ncbi:50S ribosomal protein L23 [Mycoplasmopsis primatum]|uniref:50S ribosomal protein L23 n=1 Tax=Mycoplasmopsis primatum TaxID=55604 RepID=UPI000495C351|nr:50S ribosomal protein L23 [Mycoplasmopsis primatum]
MEITRVIHKPILTEKSNLGLEKNLYTFEVEYSANKYQIKKAIEFIFKVKVLSVNTIKVDKQPKNLGRYHGFKNRYKKALVKLADGYKITLYPQEETKQDEAKLKAQAASAKAEKAATKEKEAKLVEKLAAKKAKAKVEKASDKKAEPAKEKAEKTTVKKASTTKKTTTKKETK